MIELQDLVDWATYCLTTKNDVTLDDLKAQFGEVAVARYGGVAISTARRERIDRRVLATVNEG